MTWYGDVSLFAPNFIRPICDDSLSGHEQESDDYLAARLPDPPPLLLLLWPQLRAALLHLGHKIIHPYTHPNRHVGMGHLKLISFSLSRT